MSSVPGVCLLQEILPEVRTFNTAIIACNMCGQPQEALKVRLTADAAVVQFCMSDGRCAARECQMVA